LRHVAPALLKNVNCRGDSADFDLLKLSSGSSRGYFKIIYAVDGAGAI
jgi:hypothetical protein